MRRTADADLRIASSAPGAASTRALSIRRAARLRELILLWHFAGSLIIEWQARLDPIGTLAVELDLGRGMLTSEERSALLEVLAEECADPRPPGSPAMLEAAGRWYCRLLLPADEDELMERTPLRLRSDVGG